MTSINILVLLFLFLVGCIVGWIGEVFFNRFFSSTNKGKWINPGFLQGPYLPIYGFGTVILYIISATINTFANNIFIDVILIFILAAILMTLLELIGGLFFTNVLHIKLWDYSEMKFNYKGVICLSFSILWGVVSVIYYFLINPFLVKAVSLYVSHIEFSFVIGIFYGFILIDLFETLNVMARLRKFTKDNDIVVTYNKLRLELSKTIDNRRSFFMLPDRKDIIEYIKTVKDELSNRNK